MVASVAYERFMYVCMCVHVHAVYTCVNGCACVIRVHVSVCDTCACFVCVCVIRVHAMSVRVCVIRVHDVLSSDFMLVVLCCMLGGSRWLEGEGVVSEKARTPLLGGGE